jgi:hypothetical protein
MRTRGDGGGCRPCVRQAPLAPRDPARRAGALCKTALRAPPKDPAGRGWARGRVGRGSPACLAPPAGEPRWGRRRPPRARVAPRGRHGDPHPARKNKPAGGRGIRLRPVTYDALSRCGRSGASVKPARCARHSGLPARRCCAHDVEGHPGARRAAAGPGPAARRAAVRRGRCARRRWRGCRRRSKRCRAARGRAPAAAAGRRAAPPRRARTDCRQRRDG